MTRLYYILIGLLIGISLSTFPTEVIIMDYSYIDYDVSNTYDFTDNVDNYDYYPCNNTSDQWLD